MKKVDISCIFYTIKTAWGQIDPKQHLCVKYVYRTLKAYPHVHYPVVPTKLGKVIKYEAKKMMSNIYLETLNIEWGQIDPKHNRRVKNTFPGVHLFLGWSFEVRKKTLKKMFENEAHH